MGLAVSEVTIFKPSQMRKEKCEGFWGQAHIRDMQMKFATPLPRTPS
jgi:hypothetical protein